MPRDSAWSRQRAVSLSCAAGGLAALAYLVYKRYSKAADRADDTAKEASPPQQPDQGMAKALHGVRIYDITLLPASGSCLNCTAGSGIEGPTEGLEVPGLTFAPLSLLRHCCYTNSLPLLRLIAAAYPLWPHHTSLMLSTQTNST